MTDYRSLYDSNYLYAFDLKGRDVTVTIKEVRGATLVGQGGKKSRKPVLFFKESHDGRGYAIPKQAVGAVIAAMYGKDYEGWVGKRITLYPSTTEVGGNTVECIRVRPGVPKASAKPGEFAPAQETPEPEAPEHFAEGREPGSEG